ncbi:MAG: OsmC family protein [Hyphomicrobiales bacterium]
MKKNAEIIWNKEMSFDAKIDDHTITIDAAPEVGGNNIGPRPKPLLLAGLGGCTGMDVISILKKMKIEPEEFKIEIESHMTDEHPKYYDKIHLIYIFKGKELNESKLKKAVSLSQEKYCGVNKLLSFGAEITFEIVIEE